MSAENFGRMLGSLWGALIGRKPRSPAPRPTTPSAAPVRTTPQPPPVATHGGEVESEWRLPPIPAGCQIYEARIQVAGLLHQKANAIRFVRSPAEHTLVFENDRANSYDRNAIKVIGVAGSTRYHVGFVPADIAKRLANTSLANVVQARLERAYVGHNDYIDIIFQIVGPKVRKKQYADS